LPRLAQAELARRQPLLRRPFSLGGRGDRDDGTTELEIVHRVVGAGTAWLARVAEGEEVDLVGPLGNGFALAEDRPRAALIAGGTGIGPMLYLAEALVAAGKEVVAFAGARTAAILPLHTDPGEPPSRAGWPTLSTAEFAARGVPTVVATDDGSLGFPGLVHEAFARWLAQSPQGTADLVVYACGPEAMMRAIAETCQGRGPRCQFALERHMACGIGTCQGCVCKVRSPGAPGWRYALVCRDGPVFPGEELLWD
jgi:dihydroorotate dehydrogenase electron transfer subunit